MLFSSSLFLFGFLTVALAVYYIFLRKTKKLKNYFLLFISLLFYSYGEPKYIWILVASIVFNWLFGLLIDKHREQSKLSKSLIVIMCIFNLGMLLVFKYLGFLLTNMNQWFSLNIDVPEIRLPIGISFFTFQAISYVIDVYRKRGKAQKNVLNVGLYLSFFPQLIAGPIVRYETIAEQIENRTENLEDFSKGCYRFMIGLIKKVMISNQMAVIADMAFDNQPGSVAFAWLGAIAYMIQIYYDFSGYSDMAIGLGSIFGFHFNENFNYPYISKTITEFWRRWHISLSTWFRDYVYIPLGGSRSKSKLRVIFNTFIVWFLTGIWHGASWNFILWGLYFFIILMFERKVFKNFLKETDKLPLPIKALLHIYSILLMIFGWILFRAQDLSSAWKYFGALFKVGDIAWIDEKCIHYLSNKGVFLLLGIIFSMPLYPILDQACNKSKVLSRVFAPLVMEGLLIISIAYLVKGTYNPFIYFNF